MAVLTEQGELAWTDRWLLDWLARRASDPKPVLDALYDWTNKTVRNQRSEIAAFERWWMRNRDKWTKKHLSRK